MAYTASQLKKVSLENETEFLKEIECIFERMMTLAKLGLREMKYYLGMQSFFNMEITSNFPIESIVNYIRSIDSQFDVSIEFEKKKSTFQNIFLVVKW